MFHRKWILPAAMALMTTTLAIAQDAAPELKTDKDKFSYALGMNFGENFRKQGIEVDPAVFAKAFAEAFSTGKTAMSEADMKTVLMAASQEIRKKQAAIEAEKGQQAQAEGDKFLADNKTKEGVVTLPSGLQYKILTAGTGDKPSLEDSVVCNYKGTLINGTLFDASEKHGGPATFPVKGVIPGWTEALQLMPVGSKWQLYIPSDLAYGDSGRPGIDPSSTLIFEVELLSIEDKSKDKAAEPAKDPDKK